MRLDRVTKMEAGYTMGMQPDGRELLVVCVKGTFDFPDKGMTPNLAEEQLPLVMADTFTGEPGLSAPVYESDYAPVKPRCDILLHGSAYAPGGKLAEKVPVGLQFGAMTKSFLVVGHREWRNGLLSVAASAPRPFRVMPVSYDTAFGGTDNRHPDPSKHAAHDPNPVGKGFHHHLDAKYIDKQPLPNTEELKNPVTQPNGSYTPMAFGPIGRSWHPRAKLAGTYDQNWLDNVFPFLPKDFDPAYYQAAPADQQVPYPKGGEPVILRNLTPEGQTVFRFPAINILVWFFLKNGEEKEQPAVVDTVMLEPDQRRFTVTCRTALPLRRNMFEVSLVVVGEHPEDRLKAFPESEEPFPMPAFPDEEGEEAPEPEEEA
ncbi:DUF2169 domain-containing protein [Desulfococcus sp.]|uniref:DUF2169 family type VI secretion system accessory protein n=1 Tax=Desulfococcus sp. TaxID=2025834 RepID=UPI00359433E0